MRNRLRQPPVLSSVKKLSLAVALLFTFAASAADGRAELVKSTTALQQSGLDGRGQIIAVVDTGADFDHCAFAEADGSKPPVNTGSAAGLSWQNFDLGRRKIVAYNFLFSCAQFPGVTGCEDPQLPSSFDNHGHGTRAAGIAGGDMNVRGVRDPNDSMAPAAKLIIQDTGFSASSPCQLPGLGCPAIDLLPMFEQAYRQGARIQTNSWGDSQANYSIGASQIDRFVWNNPDALVIFNAGNRGMTGASSVSSPGSAKNGIQVGGTRYFNEDDDVIWSGSGRGPTRDGRIKPDLVQPSFLVTSESDRDVRTGNCAVASQGGTSWSAPSLAAAAALVRQYFVDGFYPSGSAAASDSLIPSAALLKATLIASARPVSRRESGGVISPAEPVPSYEQGFGFADPDRALYFQGESSRLKILDRSAPSGLQSGDAFLELVRVHGKEPMRIVLVWTDPPADPAAPHTALKLIHDLDLSVTDPTGKMVFGNSRLTGGNPDRLNNVEMISIEAPVAGTYRVRVAAHRVAAGARQSFALVLVGDFNEAPVRTRPRRSR